MLKLLIVDDEKMIRIGFEKLVNWEKYNIQLVPSCSNGKEALDYLINNPIDILITDIKMPVMDGITLLSELKNRHINLKVTLVLSAFDEYNLIRNCFKLNIDDYLLKSNYDESSIVSLMLKLIKAKEENDHKNENKISYSFEILQILDYLNKNYHKSITLKSISESINYSESYISHIFSKEVGLTITEYLTKIRVENAAALLENTSLKIYEISSKVGFQTVEHFSRSFKKCIGVSPKQYKSNSAI